MLFKSTIFNHNFYPVKIEDINTIIRDSDKISEANDFIVDNISTTRLFLKPFQSEYFYTTVNPIGDEDVIEKNIYLDTTITTDSYDYGKFINITGQPVYIKRKHINFYIDRESIIFNIVPNEIQNTVFSDIDIRFSLKNQPDIKYLLKQLSIFSNNIQITDFDIVGDGIYIGESVNPPQGECSCDVIVKRSYTLLDNDEIKNILSLNNNNEYGVEYDSLNDDLIFKLKIDNVTLKNLISNVASKACEAVKNSEDDKLLIPLVQQPLGITAIFNLTPESSHPFLLNIKFIDAIMFNIDCPNMTEPEKRAKLPSQLRNVSFVDAFPSSLIPSHSNLFINAYPNSFTSSTIKLSPFIARNINTTNDNTTISYTITNIQLEHQTENIIIQHDNLPITKLIPQKTINKNLEKTEIILDFTNIHNETNNKLLIDYNIGNSSTKTLEIPITVTPMNLEAKISEFEIVGDSYRKCILEEGGNIIRSIDAGPYTKIVGYLEVLSNQSLINETIDIILHNVGTIDATINDIELIDEETCIKDYNDKYQELIDKKYILNRSKQKATDYITLKLKKIENEQNNLNNIYPIKLKINVFRKKATSVDEKYGASGILKIRYNDNKIFLIPLTFYNFKSKLKVLSTNKELPILLPSKRDTLFFNIFNENINLPYKVTNKLHGTTVVIKGCNVIGENITNDEFFIEKSQFPLSLQNMDIHQNNNISFNIDFAPQHNNKIYDFNIRIFTDLPYLPFIDFPFKFLCSKIKASDFITFDEKDFFVVNNKYFLSLLKLKNKRRKINIINNSDNEFIVNKIIFYSQKDRFDVPYVQINMLKNINLPFILNNKNKLTLDLDFVATDVGHFIGFIILTTNFGDVQLPVSVFCNTKLKDVYILMKNRRGVEFSTPLQGIDREYIELINFGNEASLIEMTKLSYDKDEFYIKNITRVAPQKSTLIETLFIPQSTGQKHSYIDIKIKDMLETFRLYESDTTQVFKIQNTHIIADMLGISFSQNAVPYFERQVIDFGYLPLNKKDLYSRYDIIKIKNLGLNPFIITKITKTNNNSPFFIPLNNKNLPLVVKKEIELPIIINNNKLNSNTKKYLDILKFEIQDLKTKQIFHHEVICRIELSEDNREYFSFNSDFVNFGYCEINHFKDDEIVIKNFSTTKTKLSVDITGASEFQTPHNFEVILQPSQTFNVPLYFFPHGIDNFNGTVTLNFNNGNYIKNIKLYGIGVDFKSPLILTENKILKYYNELLKNFI